MVRSCPDCGSRVWPTAVRTRPDPQMPEFTTVHWDCPRCDWRSDPDGFIGSGGDEPTSAWLTREQPATEAADAETALTDHERAVVKLIAASLSNQQIADELVVSINTVKTTIISAYRKMQVNNRTQALLWAVRHGLIDP